MTWCCKAEPNLAEQARDKLWEKQLFTSSGTPMSWDLPLSSVHDFVMLLPAGPSTELWALACLQPVMVPAQMSDMCDSAALVTSPEGHYSYGPALATTPSGHADICAIWPCYPSVIIPDVLSHQVLVHGPLKGSCQWTCHLWATTLSLLVSALGWCESTILPCHLNLWRGA